MTSTAIPLTVDGMGTHRIIFALYLDLAPLTPGTISGLVVPLNRDGQSVGRNGRARPPKRTIDLRVGDSVMVEGRWRRILGIRAYREAHATAEQAEAIRDGYVVR